eukprot:10090661-Ditylum_brightwellii.AAC.1
MFNRTFDGPINNTHSLHWLPDWLPSYQQEREDKENIDDDEFLADVIMTRLRTAEGMDLDWITEYFGDHGREKVDKVLRGAQLGLELNLAYRTPKMQENESDDNNDQDGYLRLVDPDGNLSFEGKLCCCELRTIDAQ